jgi:hypothetical protein
MPYIPRNYTDFQFIAYEIPTLTPVGPGNEYQAIGRVPVPQGLPNDERIRLKRFAGLVNLAKNRVTQSGDNANTLKIFMAPEFYFRPNAGPSNSYANGAMNNILQALRSMFVDPAFADWLIIPGTIFWSQPAGVGGRVVFFNTTVLIKGGAADAPFYYVHKRQISSIDGAPQVDAAVLNKNLKPLLTTWDERRQNVQTLDHQWVGVDVCLDHADSPAYRTLKTVCVEYQGRHGIIPPLSLHLLTACGMEIKPRSVAARVNGHILRVDGVPNAIGLQWPSPRSEIQRITAQNYLGNAALTNQSATGVNLGNANWTYNITGNGLRLDTVSPVHDGIYPQRLVCYQRQPL